MIRDLLLVCVLDVTGILAVIRPPGIREQPPHEVFFKAGEQVTLPCVADAVPNASYTWSRNGIAFDPSGIDDRVHQLPNVGTIVFNRPEDKDEGIYQCFADNGFGMSATIRVNLREARLREFSIEDGSHLYPKLGDHYVLNCVPPPSVPSADVYWISKGNDGHVEPITFDARVTMAASRLYFTNVKAEDYRDGKAYACMAMNRIVRKNTQGPSYFIMPQGTKDEKKPVTYLYSSLRYQLSLRGDPLKIECIFAGNPTPDVYWVRSGRLPLPNHTNVSSSGHELVFEQLDFSDKGDYECWGKNELTPNGVRRTFSINVQSRPSWIEEPKDVEIGPDGTAHFKCLADGVPKPDVFWFINTVPLPKVTDPRIDYRFHKVGDVEVIFMNVTKNDDMVIQCNVTNKHGYIWGDVYLNVLCELAVL